MIVKAYVLLVCFCLVGGLVDNPGLEAIGGCSKGPCKRRDHWEYTSLKGDPNQTGNLHYDHFGDRYVEQLPIMQSSVWPSDIPCPHCKSRDFN